MLAKTQIRTSSGEEVSVSLLYSRIKDRPNTPHPCVQEKKHHAKKREWVPNAAGIPKQRYRESWDGNHRIGEKRKNPKTPREPMLYKTRRNKAVKTAEKLTTSTGEVRYSWERSAEGRRSES